MMRKWNILLIALLALQTLPSRADEDNVLDFEAEVIEGKKRMPEFFLQTATVQTEGDTLIYLRKDFNDAHAEDRGLRPSYHAQ